ncbi:MAG: hypothetical protein A2452_09740 [Candidatus Firestonebacteria bacterium RIFOXYC2_FULL_39_67]|nr:MAG: hypothetical protein A2536_04030 [Candidatus Firestonebacteria bacterium RIFOXYD2_FULL_39_29]OGF51855.1 MAG: hypothetical protein A2497_00745 [Candidatus Firestonebacteria bacterium RifOxyC12_full_39_7]OGF54644.1 MAG: hypothetical protein A2452_09740 [Candidatus Firestonebacteria bacterium RIFOXYC2_FULL_39_67]
MKIKNVYHFFAVLFVCACTGLNGAFFGQAGGVAGSITGVVTGVIAGYLFLDGYYKTKRIWKERITKATNLGGIYGAISGFLVHIPNLLYPLKGNNSMLGIFLWAGPLVGAISGLILGIILGSILYGVRMESEEESKQVEQEEKPKENA